MEQDFEFYVKESEIYSSGNFNPLKVSGRGAPMDLCAKLLQSCLTMDIEMTTNAPNRIVFRGGAAWCSGKRSDENTGKNLTSCCFLVLISCLPKGSPFTLLGFPLYSHG